jgi:hypothetical protein
MATLNEGLTIDQLPAGDRGAFRGGARPRLFPAGWRFYKFTRHPLAVPVSPWWSSVDPLDAGDPGLAGVIERATRLGVPTERFARVRSAVTQQWNPMDNLIRIRLTAPVYGVVGRCAAQRVDETLPANVVFIGGAWQAFIPNLTFACLAQD